MTSLILSPKLSLVTDQPPCRSINLVTDQVGRSTLNANITATLGFTSEDGVDGSIDAAEIEHVDRERIVEIC